MKHSKHAIQILVALFFIPFAGAAAQDVSDGLKAFPDFMSIRSEFLSIAITADPSRALAFQPAYRESPYGRVRVSVAQDGPLFHVLFQLQRNGEYVPGSRGNIIIDRQTKTGYITRIAWCLSDDGQSWILLTPNNERTIVDYVVAGTVVRGNYRISSLIYVFLTNPFRYLYDMTRAGIDWSPILGSPTAGSATVALAKNLESGHPDAAGLALVRGAGDFARIGEYLALIGADTSVQPVEEVAAKGQQVLELDGGMPSRLLPVRPYRPDRGLPVEAAAGILAAGVATDSVYVGIMDAGAGSQPLKLAIVPCYGPTGACRIVAIDASTRLSVDLPALMARNAGGWIRLFRLPGPSIQS